MVLCTCSKFLYELTRSDGYNPSESIVSKWVRAIASKLGVSLSSTDHLKTVLVRRANFLRGKVKTFKGSAKRQQYLQLTWELRLDQQDIEFTTMKNKIESLEDELAELQQEVSHVGEDIEGLKMERNTLQKQEEELSIAVDNLTQENKRLRKQARQLCSKTSSDSPRTRGRSYKPDEEYSESHQRRLKRLRTKICDQSLSWLQDEGYVPMTVTVVNALTGKEETIALQNQHLTEIFGQSDEMSEESLERVNMILYIKDWYNVSDCAYHELAKVCAQMPRQYKLRERISELNTLWNIQPTPNDTKGVQQKLKDRLEVRIRHLLAMTNDPNASFVRDKIVRVKLSGDGTKIGNGSM